MLCKEECEVFRPNATFSKNIWRDQFSPNGDLDLVIFHTLSTCYSQTGPDKQSQVFDSLTKEIDPLKEKVKDMLMASAVDLVEKVKFIDTLVRLGVSYHLEKDIENQLETIFKSHHNLFTDNHRDINTTSIVFRVFRQHGFKMSCDELALKEGISYSVPYAKDALIGLAGNYQAEMMWCRDGYVPTFEKYMSVATKTSTYDLALTIAFMGMGKIAGKDAFEWLRNEPEIMKALNVIGHLMDDIVSHKVCNR
ncbi:hypothetical protein V6N13_017656 [Hibiscus sabdariffa]